MKEYKIISEEHKLVNGVVEGKFILSNTTIILFEMTADNYWNQWGGSKEEHANTVDRLDEIYFFYYQKRIR